ncbi:bifunctional helix-turn-helix transcriptional regulator/GNAT family N-acetyltransferase [Epibacterium ulvae]|uniref:bifunctional helix-turn-helix transcriptional regulator/GNAT family N-acetyltransferase n=1 Tax=Epibacterium ulvae TaxID=1156985 RepID=UPI001BFCD20F|nr:bifunctional helix-turn-helix transcriptional regulator/GNAT family N-acetyltransferase [Epibacterium ulvae]MBT8154059.1 bifunctional helix-turn-helix transcriptional regulator/GNAT family N-acetyltransferase [Epibacterium ulvae]
MTDPQTITTIRAASRLLVRELGFMGGDFAGTDLPPSAVHALIEIEGGEITAKELSQRLHLEKSSVSRMLRKLVGANLIMETPGTDARVKTLSLTDSGADRLAAIHRFASTQVKTAVQGLQPAQTATIAEGLALYAQALAQTDLPSAPIHYHCGYQSGLVARIIGLHMDFYAKHAGFGDVFETALARGLSDFIPRAQNTRNAIWTAQRSDKIIGSITIDGEDLGHDIAHLRWFIVDQNTRGSGVGRALLDKAVAFVDAQGFCETQLWTFKGLDAARTLYEAQGFKLADEQPGTQWGAEVLEQRFVRKHIAA